MAKIDDSVKKKVPELRFKGFTDEWEQRKLGDEVRIVMGQSPNSENYTDDPNDYILVQGNADMKNGRVLPRVWTTQVTKQAEKDDLILSVRAPVGDIGKTAYDVVIGRGVAAIKGNEFIFQNLGKMKSDGYWTRYSTGSTFESINSTDIKEAIISVPAIEEQDKIGSFFKQLDNTITLHQRKLDLLKEQKKGYLQKMFPKNGAKVPELRFAGFADDWEDRKLRDLLNKNSEKNKNLSVINVESVSNKTGFTKQTDQFEDYSVASADLSNYYVIREKQFAYNPSRINVGSIAYKDLGDEISVVSPLYVSFSTKKVLNDGFLWNWFKTASFDAQRQRLSEGGVRDTLSFNQLSEMNTMFPTYPEQEKIGSFFQQLDETIALHQRKLDLLKEQKKGFLQKMFV
ncbi:restriction endonuclease subunit S [Pediococcus acidilactici]|uniref:restriction endonuclease subunit S n=1 Tax=Pediococcus acidilactici TaxID=1254 RepID=UPI001321624F|nr:restriction endonuclease subunit S [Pediococcus acidilactici]KAF0429807.1 restriction endonuclease subunit S [Pediococcus acidilactici]KAF0492762.1 restriction endonuclease subunit S [Pediococcus acidilactici]